MAETQQITGTLVAKHHHDTWPDKRVVVLEAREFCSGATGRNAGHCKPDQYRGFAKYEKAFGKEQALKVSIGLLPFFYQKPKLHFLIYLDFAK